MSRRTACLLTLALLAFSRPAPGEKRVTLCHLPPGNPDRPQTIVVAEAAVPAHVAHGDAVGACVPACPESCDDGNLCTSDSCGADGTCLNVPISCDDGSVCTLDACDPGIGCLRLPDDGRACDDGSACTSADRCTGATCQGTPIAGCCVGDFECDDTDPCTDDTCLAGSCTNTARSCAVDDKCLAGFCDASGACATAAVSCDDSNVCTDDACDPVFGCTHAATTSPPEPVEVSCADGTDNDCDGAVDGADPDCPFCGDGVVQPGEECDDGNEHPFDGCDLCRLVDITPD